MTRTAQPPEVTCCFRVHDRFDGGTIFIREWEDHSKVSETGRIRYGGTLAAVTSFGVYGYTWTLCGVPFRQFLCQLNRDYLLSKISKRQTSEKKLVASVRREILQLRKDEQISADQAREAWDYVDELEVEGCHHQVLAHLIYHSAEMPSEFDFTDLDTQEWPSDAIAFHDKLWPLIVAQLEKESTP